MEEKKKTEVILIVAIFFSVQNIIFQCDCYYSHHLRKVSLLGTKLLLGNLIDLPFFLTICPHRQL